MDKELHKKSLKLLVEVFETNVETNKKILELLKEISEDKKKEKPEESKEEEKLKRGRPKKKSKPQPQQAAEKQPGSGAPVEQGGSKSGKSGTPQTVAEGSPGEVNGEDYTEEELKLVKMIRELAIKEIDGGTKTDSGETVDYRDSIPRVTPASYEAPEESSPSSSAVKPAENIHIPSDRLWCGVCKKYHTRGTHD